MKRWAYIILLTAVTIPIFAQPEEEDVAGQGVARLSVINGDVSIRRGDSGDFIAAALNAPLVVTDRLVTGPQSRAEIQFDWANMIRIGSNAEIRLSELEYRRYQIQIAIGTTTFRVLRNSNADVEISTPSVSVRPLGRGVYRVMVREDGSSEITVRSGEADVFSPRGAERLRAGSTMLARGSAQDPEFQQVAAIPYDGWDNWNDARDRDLERSQAYQYVSPDIYGAEDLDGHGRWVNVEGYGNVWSPAVDPSWAPYRYGRWVWEDYYGWTWVSYDPWGWAPYHYGRWLFAGGYGWCWWPGGIHGRYYWRPALVAFFGFGGYGGFNAGFGFGFGNIGWVPLAPFETFHPWYGRGIYGGFRGTTVVNNTTIINNTNIASAYRNARVMNGVTAVNSETFGRRAITNQNLVRVTGNQLQSAGLVHGVLPVTPARESLRMADRSVSAASVSRATENRSFYSRQPARTTTARVPFEQQRQGMDQVARRTFGGGNSSPAQTPGGWGRGNPTGSSAPQEQGSWRRFGDPTPHNAGTAWSSQPGTQGYRGNYSAPSSPAAPRDARSYQGGYSNPGAASPRGYENYAPRSSGGYGSGGSQPVRLNPQIVHERPSSSAPSPHYSAPAPHSSGGGGGGGSRGGHTR